jgi:hypothetical protein
MFYFLKCDLQTNDFYVFDLLIFTCFTLSNIIHKPMVTVYFDLDAFSLRTVVYLKPFRPFYNPTFAYYVIK